MVPMHNEPSSLIIIKPLRINKLTVSPLRVGKKKILFFIINIRDNYCENSQIK